MDEEGVSTLRHMTRGLLLHIFSYLRSSTDMCNFLLCCHLPELPYEVSVQWDDVTLYDHGEAALHHAAFINEPQLCDRLIVIHELTDKRLRVPHCATVPCMALDIAARDGHEGVVTVLVSNHKYTSYAIKDAMNLACMHPTPGSGKVMEVLKADIDRADSYMFHMSFYGFVSTSMRCGRC
jgi:hypothetical protein